MRLSIIRAVLACAIVAVASGTISATAARAQDAEARTDSRTDKDIGFRIAELAIEVSGNQVLFPSGGIGNVVVTPCEGCRPVALLASSRTQYFSGDQPIRFNDLRTALVRAPAMQLVVLYDARTLELSRVLSVP